MAKDGEVPASSASNKSETDSILSGSNARYLEAQYARYKADSGSVSQEWREFFESEAGASDGSLQADGGAGRRLVRA